MSWKLATLLKETLYLAPDGVLTIKFGPREVLRLANPALCHEDE
jgi:hypothetical protein